MTLPTKPGRRVATRLHALHPDVAACAAEHARIARIRNVRLRVAAMKAHVRACSISEPGQRALCAADGAYAARQLRGYVSRGWWYPRTVMLGIFWGSIIVLGVLLVVGLLTLPELQA